MNNPRVIPVDTNGVLLGRIGVDAFECDRDGKPLVDGPVGMNMISETSRMRAEQRQVREDYQVPVAAGKAVPGPTIQRMTQDDPKSEEQLKIDAEEKSRLLAIARDDFLTELDPNDSVGVIRARVNMLRKNAPLGAEKVGGVALPARRFAKRKYKRKSQRGRTHRMKRAAAAMNVVPEVPPAATPEVEPVAATG
jgi:hypothetical protein